MISRKKGEISTLADIIARDIRKKIITGKYRHGDRLLINKIAEEYNVSIIPVREALKLLTEEGFVTTEAYKGTVVADVSPEKIFLMRHVIREIVKMAYVITAEKMDDKMYKKFRFEIDNYFKPKSDISYWDFIQNFHGAMIDLAGIPSVSNIFRIYFSYIAPLYDRASKSMSFKEYERDEFYKILDLIKEKNSSGAIEIFNSKVEKMEPLHLKILEEMKSNKDSPPSSE